MRNNLKQTGFTITELVISIVITGILVLILGDFFTNNMLGLSRNENQLTNDHNTRLAAETVNRYIRQAQSVELTNSIADPNQPSGWTSGANTIVLSVPALDSSQNPIYTDTSHSSVYNNNIIFYIDNSIIYRRVLSNTNAPGNNSVTTCPPALASPGCPPDPKVNDTHATLSIDYGGPINEASLITVTLTQSLNASGGAYTSTLTTKTALRNK